MQRSGDAEKQGGEDNKKVGRYEGRMIRRSGDAEMQG